VSDATITSRPVGGSVAAARPRLDLQAWPTTGEERAIGSSQGLVEPADFPTRHIGLSPGDEEQMLAVIGAATLESLLDEIVPERIRRRDAMRLPPPVSEAAALAELRAIAGRNRVLKSFIGQGYHGTRTPAVILRNVLENPAWYTAYTPYQAEISQGRMEAVLNFQTMVCDLTAMPIANASMRRRPPPRR
jgi:glycine dehydrogenase